MPTTGTMHSGATYVEFIGTIPASTIVQTVNSDCSILVPVEESEGSY